MLWLPHATRVIESPELERTIDELTNKLLRAEQELKISAGRIAGLEKSPSPCRINHGSGGDDFLPPLPEIFVSAVPWVI